MKSIQPGDILFYKTNRHSWFVSRLIATFSKTFGEDSKNGHYCHVALVGYGDVSDGFDLYEMAWPKARLTRLDLQQLTKHYDVETWRVKDTLMGERHDAVEWANDNLGMKYDLGLILFGLFDDKHKEVCSTFVYKAWKAAGVDLYPNASKEKVVSPSELATSPLLERVC